MGLPDGGAAVGDVETQEILEEKASSLTRDELVAEAKEALISARDESKRAGVWARSDLLQEQLTLLGATEKSPDSEAQALAARLAMMKWDWPSAVAMWREIPRDVVAGSAEYSTHFALALAGQGNFPEAFRVLEDSSAGEPAIRKVAEKADGWVADYLSRKHFRDSGAVADEPPIFLTAALMLQGHLAQDAEILASTARLASTFRKAQSFGRIAPPNQEEPGGGSPLFVTGFDHSGSGAIVDMLKGNPAIGDCLGTSELGLFHGSYGPTKILEAESDPEIRIAASNFVFWNLLGILPPPPVSPHRSHSLARLANDPTFVTALACIGRQFLEGLDSVGSFEFGRPQALRGLYKSLFGLCDQSKKYTLVNNSLRSDGLSLMPLMPLGSKYIAVLRDPRDQYASQRLTRSAPFEPKRYAAAIGRQYARFFERYEKGLLEGNVLAIRFEDLVTSPLVREMLLSWLGVEESASGFDPEASARNVGIFKHCCAAQEIDVVETDTEALREKIDGIDSVEQLERALKKP